MVLRFGKSEFFLRDNGREFKNQMVDQYLEEIGVTHETTPIYHAHANSIERVNQTVKTRVMASWRKVTETEKKSCRNSLFP